MFSVSVMSIQQYLKIQMCYVFDSEIVRPLLNWHGTRLVRISEFSRTFTYFGCKLASVFVFIAAGNTTCQPIQNICVLPSALFNFIWFQEASILLLKTFQSNLNVHLISSLIYHT